jgi:hypothetical protein
VRQHDLLGPARRTGGVQQQRHIVRPVAADRLVGGWAGRPGVHDAAALAIHRQQLDPVRPGPQVIGQAVGQVDADMPAGGTTPSRSASTAGAELITSDP